MKQTFFSILLILFPMLASAEAVEIDGIYYNFVPKGNVIEVTRNPSGFYSGSIVIPGKVTYEGSEYSVSIIGEAAFDGCSGLTSIELPNSLTTIGQYAFSGCSGLTFITIPNKVTSIGRDAFSGCGGLVSVTIPNSVTSIGKYAFEFCSSLTSITIPNSVTTIGRNAFFQCSGLTSITIPNSVTSIEKYAFDGCSSISSITIGSGITNIETSFSKCLKLTDVTCMAENVPFTSSDAFEGSLIEYATLHVPEASIEAYKVTAPWCNFKNIVSVGGGDIPEMPKCAMPTISLVDGEILFGCETEDAEFVSEVTVSDAKEYYDNKISAPKKFKVTVRATKSGYDDSDEVTEEFDFSRDTSHSGDVNGDGKVDVADHVKLSSIIVEK